MRTPAKNNVPINKEAIRESILKSMIASFKIEKIDISEKAAQEIYLRVIKRLKKAI